MVDLVEIDNLDLSIKRLIMEIHVLEAFKSIFTPESDASEIGGDVDD